MTNNSNIIEEGLVSTAIKTGAKIAGKIIAKSSPKAAKVLAKPAVRKAGTLAAKKLIRTKAFRNFVRAASKSKIFSLLKNKKFIQGAVKAGKAGMYADTIMDMYDMVKDYKSGAYKDVSWETVAAAGTTVIYTASPKEITSGDEELDQEVVKEGIDSIKSDLEKYKEWKKKQQPKAIENESVNRSLLFEETKTFQVYFNILLESAQTDAEKLEVVKKADPKLVETLKKSVKTNGNVEIPETDVSKVKKLINKDDKTLNQIKSAHKKIDLETIDKILAREKQFKSLTDEIFSKETLMSIIPFSSKPTPKDISNFFKALHDWTKGTYKFDEFDTSELIGIGVDVGIQTIILATRRNCSNSNIWSFNDISNYWMRCNIGIYN